MSAPRPFEPRLVRARKRRAAAGFRDAAFLHQRVVADLADRLEAIPRPFSRALALGGSGLFGEEVRQRPALAERIGEIIEADVAVGAVVLDPEAFPFAETAFDLIVSPLALHTVNDVPGALIQLRRALKPDGLLLASLFGGDTLTELRTSLLTAEAELTGGAGARVSPFADLQDLAALLQRAGFALPAADRDKVTVRYAEPMRLLADLRAMGETAALTERHPRALSRRVLARAFEVYRERFSDADGRICATFEILTATGWAPHESQPKPLKPGSAKARLADVLKTTEQSTGEKAGD
ncbi:methyltransferase domain-containing protein [Terricaulis silvestris]|uniref:Biotin biosynthesis protein BioC n=1 Tax=Terricaulis silvestris TaxID=2686094 RepID=A0A6I6MIY6_9CAUL|nr:methyltransferase domain-containing protein [Terricaulis silvestris]QGZ95070.1 biotin biosynthesis protein BioC [Terricaulis silvestris]